MPDDTIYTVIMKFIYYPPVLISCLLGVLAREYWGDEAWMKIRKLNGDKSEKEVRKIRIGFITVISLFLSLLTFSVYNTFWELDVFKATSLGGFSGILGYTIIEALIGGSGAIVKRFTKEIPFGDVIVDAINESEKEAETKKKKQNCKICTRKDKNGNPVKEPNCETCTIGNDNN